MWALVVVFALSASIEAGAEPEFEGSGSALLE